MLKNLLNKGKSLLLGLVKSQVTANLSLLDSALQPKLADLLAAKTNVQPDKAAALAASVIAILKDEIVVLLGKI